MSTMRLVKKRFSYINITVGCM